MTPFPRALAHTLASEGYYTDRGPTYRDAVLVEPV